MTEYPGNVQIETTSACNARCGFCPHSAMERDPAKMGFDLFHKILNELAGWEQPPNQICPFLTNEPFADNRMPLLIAAINNVLPNARVVFFTNGSLFSERTIENLKGLKIGNFTVSLHHSTKAEYEAELGIEFEKTIAGVHRLIDSGLAPVQLLRVTDNNADRDRRFMAFTAKEFPGTPAGCVMRFNWKGDIASPFAYEHTLDRICPRHGSMTILVDGRVSLCCLDQNGDYALGDTKEKSLIDIYNGPKALSYRTRTKRQSTPCSSCNME